MGSNLVKEKIINLTINYLKKKSLKFPIPYIHVTTQNFKKNKKKKVYER